MLAHLAGSLSKSNTLALRASEVTALAAVAGAVTMVRAEKEVSLSFEAVKERVRDELDMWALGP